MFLFGGIMKTIVISAALAALGAAAQAASYTYEFTATYDTRLAGSADDSTFTDTIGALPGITGTIVLSDVVTLTPGGKTVYEAPIVDFVGIDEGQFVLPSAIDVLAAGDIKTFTTLSIAPSTSKNVFSLILSGLTPQDYPASIDFTKLTSATLTFATLANIDSRSETLDEVAFTLTSFDLVTPVPLPAGLPLLAAGLFGLGLLRRRA